MDTNYKVSVTGFTPNIPSEDVAKKLSLLLNITLDDARQLLSRQNGAVKLGVDFQTAVKYVDALEKAGCVCEVEPDYGIDGAISKDEPTKPSFENMRPQEISPPAAVAATASEPEIQHATSVKGKYRPIIFGASVAITALIIGYAFVGEKASPITEAENKTTTTVTQAAQALKTQVTNTPASESSDPVSECVDKLIADFRSVPGYEDAFVKMPQYDEWEGECRAEQGLPPTELETQQVEEPMLAPPEAQYESQQSSADIEACEYAKERCYEKSGAMVQMCLNALGAVRGCL